MDWAYHRLRPNEAPADPAGASSLGALGRGWFVRHELSFVYCVCPDIVKSEGTGLPTSGIVCPHAELPGGGGVEDLLRDDHSAGTSAVEFRVVDTHCPLVRMGYHQIGHQSLYQGVSNHGSSMSHLQRCLQGSYESPTIHL